MRTVRLAPALGLGGDKGARGGESTAALGGVPSTGGGGADADGGNATLALLLGSLRPTASTESPARTALTRKGIIPVIPSCSRRGSTPRSVSEIFCFCEGCVRTQSGHIIRTMGSDSTCVRRI